MIGVIYIRIIISPAKKMKIDNNIFAYTQMPMFVEKSQILSDYLKTLNFDELKYIWKCSDNIAKQNFNIIKDMDLFNNLTPAILAYEGLQYQYMGAEVFTYNQIDYIEKHVRILSGFYGILKPLDGIVPYRLEMQSRLIDWEHRTLYEFWEDKIANSIFSESNCILNLASKEYSKIISKYLTENTKFINCVFGEIIDGKVIEKGTFAKMARGEMVRFMAENNIKEAEDIKIFNRLNYVYNKKLSDDANFVFIKVEK